VIGTLRFHVLVSPTIPIAINLAKVVSMFKVPTHPELVPSHNNFFSTRPTNGHLLIWWGSSEKNLIFNFETRQQTQHEKPRNLAPPSQAHWQRGHQNPQMGGGQDSGGRPITTIVQ
jgi:hypothetical protein